MKQLIYHIIKRIPGILLILLAVAPAMAQKPVQNFEVTQCDTLQLQIEEMPGDEYSWEIYSDPSVNFAKDRGDMEPALYFENGMYRDVSSVRILGLPAGRYFVKVTAWDEEACTNNLLVFSMDVIATPPPEVYGDSLCVGDVPIVRVVFTGTGPWEFSYTYSDGVNYVNGIGQTDDPEYIFQLNDPLPVGKTTFWIMEVTDACTIKTYEVDDRPKANILIYPKPTNSKIYLKKE